jgi:hypothetical protein
MYPAADVPVLQVSLPSLDPTALFSLGRSLAPLRREGVLIVGSGFLTHNLRTVDFRPDAPTPAWASEFDAWAGDVLARRDVDALLDYRERAPGVRQALPTHEHFVPVLVSMGAADRRAAPPRCVFRSPASPTAPPRAAPFSSASRSAPQARCATVVFSGSSRAKRGAIRLRGDSGRRGIRIAALLLPVATTTCAGHLPPCPAAGGPAWTELRSAHFRLRTDKKPADARVTLTDLEQLRAALLKVFGAPVDFDTGQVPVVVVDSGWTDFAPRQVNGFFTRALFQPLVVMAATSQLYGQELIKHELVHFLSNKVMTHQPPWMAEGLASYYETIEYDTETGRITVGRPTTGASA